MVFRLPSDPSTNYIKRLVGLPGDHVVVREQPDVRQPAAGRALDGYSGPYGSTPRAQIGLETLGDHQHRTLYIDERPSDDFDDVVPAGHYLLHGRQPRQQPRQPLPGVGYVPDGNVVGKAVRIWMNWNLPHAPLWERIGQAIR